LILVLFDVDGTLTRGAGAGARALERAFAELFGWPDACRGLRFHGGTDRGLVRTVLERNGRTAGAEVDAVLARYVEILPEEADKTPYQALAGAAEILEAVVEDGAAIGLVTGNHPVAAERKLRSAGLWRTFAGSAFGSESEDRARLVRLAMERSGARPTRVYHVGDTENDVRAARAAGARAVAVATGGATRGELEAETPDAIFSDLVEATAARFWRS